MEITPENKFKLGKGLKVALIALLVVFVFNALFDEPHYRKESQENNTITFSGHGEVTAVPDIANIYFTIAKEAATVKEAQALVAEVEKKSLDLLRESGVAEKDFKTSYASFSPKYEYRYETKSMMPCTQYGCPPRPGKNVIVGYTASESITIKIRNVDDAGKIMQGLGTLGVTDLSGPNFAIDKEDELKAEARKKAIEDAKMKAKVLARDLGVRLGDITSFSEGANYGGGYYKRAMMDASLESAAPAPAQLPKGENIIASDVTITYELDD